MTTVVKKLLYFNIFLLFIKILSHLKEFSRVSEINVIRKNETFDSIFQTVWTTFEFTSGL